MFEFDEKNYFTPCGRGLFPRDKNFTLTEDMETTKNELHAMCDRLLRFEKELDAKFADLMSHLASDNTTFKNTFAESYRLFMEEVKKEINNFESNVDNTITLYQRVTDARLEEIEEKLANAGF